MDWSLLGFGPKHPCPEKFSQEVEPGDGVTKTGTYRCFRSKELIGQYDPEVKTAFDIMSNAVKNYPMHPFHGKRVGDKFEWKTYEEVFEEVRAFGSGLVAIDALVPDVTGEMKLLGLMGRNHSHWNIAEYGCLGWSGTTVPFYDSLSAETLYYLIDNCGLATVVCDAPSARKLIEAKGLGATTLKTLILYGTEQSEVESIAKAAAAADIKVLTFEEVLQKGSQKLLLFDPPTGDNIYSFVFTSGSTGKFPKAALIKHSSVVSNATAVVYEYDQAKFPLQRGAEVHLSYLPCGHAMERGCFQLMMSVGGSLGYSDGIREKVMEEIALLRPTLFVTVPRILNRLHDKIMSGAMSAGGVKTYIFTKALEAKAQGVLEGYLKHPIYDPLVFNPIKVKLGLDRCSRIVTGSAPIAAEVLMFYRAVFGMPVSEGYGATEMTMIATGTSSFHMKSGHVGGPVVCVEVRLMAIPSMPHYKVTDTKHGDLDVCGRGELCVRGLGIMREYYRNPEATKAAIDEEGFYHSGDVAALLPDGTFKIIDRKNNIFKLSNGEYVSPETIENKIIRAPLVMQAYVHGDTLHARLVAVIVPDPDTAIPFAKANGLPADLKELCGNKTFMEAVLNEISVAGKREGLRGFELPWKIHLDPEPFTDKNVLTATLKLQRTLAFNKYQPFLEQMLGDEK